MVFKPETMEDLQKRMADKVCRGMAIQNKTPYVRTSILVRMPATFKLELMKVCRKENRSMNNLVLTALSEYINKPIK